MEKVDCCPWEPSLGKGEVTEQEAHLGGAFIFGFCCIGSQKERNGGEPV